MILGNLSFLKVIFIILKLLFTLICLVASGAFISILERKLLGLFQNRYGPNRVGWNGCLQIFADMIKIFFKEDWIPLFSNKIIFVISPLIACMSFILIFCMIPISMNMFIINLNIGVLFFLMMVGLSIYSVLLAGWSSNNKYALLGAIRASAQILSYEVFLGLSLMGVVAKAGSFNIVDIINNQSNIWNILPQFFGFLTFFISSIAICHRHPFDQPESEQELSDGYHIEYSSMKFGLFFIGEYIAVIILSSLITSMFLGGFNGPLFPSFVWFFIKVFLCIFVFILIRASLPRPRYDQMMYFGWVYCFPLALINFIITAAILLYQR